MNRWSDKSRARRAAGKVPAVARQSPRTENTTLPAAMARSRDRTGRFYKGPDA